jgi:hypothetical protein
MDTTGHSLSDEIRDRSNAYAFDEYVVAVAQD